MCRVCLILFLALSLFACKREKGYTDKGTLVGIDGRYCACCGGLILEANNGMDFNIESLPGVTSEELYKMTYPRKISYNWKADRTCGGITYITITSFRFD